MAANTAATAGRPALDPWDPGYVEAQQAGQTTDDPETLTALVRHVAPDLPPNLPHDPMEVMGAEIDASTLFPEDEWATVPQLTKDRVKEMTDTQTPFTILHVGLRNGEFGRIFVLVVDVGGQVFSTVLGADEEYRREKLAKVAYFLQHGAKSVGPFKFTSAATDKGNDYRSIAAIPRKAGGKK